MRKSSKKLSSSVAANVAANVPAIIEPANTAAPVSAELSPVSASELANGVTIDNVTGENVQPENVAADTTNASEATPDARVLKAERVAADRAAVHALYASFEANRLSVPVKALSAFKLAKTTAHPIARNPSDRQCAAIALALAAAGAKLTDGAKAARVFEINGVPSAIENGVLRDAVSSGLIRVTGSTPETETIVIANKAAATISGRLGSKILKAANLI